MRAHGPKAELQGWPRCGPSSPPQKGPVEGQAWPRVSLVTPSFNQARFLEDTILSVLNQGYPDLEYMVIDGGSTDGSPEVIRRHADRLAYWESTPDQGQSHAINKGWQRATGKYLWWLNSDDMLTPDSLASAVRYLEANPAVDLIYGDLLSIDGEGQPLGVWSLRDFDFADFMINGGHVAQPGGLARRETVGRVGYLDEGLHYLMDWDFWMRLGLSGGRLIHLPQTLAMYRVYDEAKTGAGSPVSVQERYLLNERLLADPRLPAGIRAQKARVTSAMHLTCSRTYLLCGDYRRAVLEAGLSVRSWPIRLGSPSLWYHGALALLGLVVGHRTWRWFRSALRRVRNTSRPGGGGEGS
jgi:glycosyltransferase involved in cell wall biosynthesis